MTVCRPEAGDTARSCATFVPSGRAGKLAHAHTPRATAPRQRRDVPGIQLQPLQLPCRGVVAVEPRQAQRAVVGAVRDFLGP